MSTKWSFGLITLCCIFSFFSAESHADEFEDFIQSCARISRNYKSAVAARESRFGKEYQMHLKAMQQQAQIVQNCAVRLGLGRDFNFTALSREIEEIFQEDKSAKIGRQRDVSGNPDGIFRILLFDVKELQKMDFTTEGGGSIKPSLERKRRLLEMKRLVRFFNMFHRRAELYDPALRRNGPRRPPRRRRSNSHRNNSRYSRGRNHRYNDPSMYKEFLSRSEKMLALSMILESIFQKQHKNGRPGQKLSWEIQQLLTCHKKIHERILTARRKGVSLHHQEGDFSPGKNRRATGRLQKDESLTALRQNIRISLRNIHDILAQWESLNFSPDPPIRHGNTEKTSAKNDDPSSLLKPDQKSGEDDYRSMSRQALNKKLIELRKEILKENTSIDGLDPATERKYLRTLSRDQTKIYRESLKKFQDQGYESGVASRNAALKTQFEITLAQKIPEKKELVRIFENIRKDEIRNKGKIKF